MKFRIRKTTCFAGDFYHLQVKRWWGWDTIDHSWSVEFLKKHAVNYNKREEPVTVEEFVL